VIKSLDFSKIQYLNQKVILILCSLLKAFVRQTNLLAKHVEAGERAALTAHERKVVNRAAAMKRREQEQTQANIQLGREDMLELNRWKFNEVMHQNE
jgi:hypothetical protein